MISKRHVLLMYLSTLALVTSAITPRLQNEFSPIVTRIGENLKIENPLTDSYNIVPANVPVYFNGTIVNPSETLRANQHQIETAMVTVKVKCDYENFWAQPFFLDLVCCAENGYLQRYYFDNEIQPAENSETSYTISTQIGIPVSGGYVIVSAPSFCWNRPGELWLIENVSDPTTQTEITFTPKMATRNFSWQMVDEEGNHYTSKKAIMMKNQVNG